MKLIVYVRDGKTRYLIEKRSTLRELNDERHLPGSDERRSIRVARSYWNHETGMWTPWEEAHLRYISKSSVSVVEEAKP